MNADFSYAGSVRVRFGGNQLAINLCPLADQGFIQIDETLRKSGDDKGIDTILEYFAQPDGQQNLVDRHAIDAGEGKGRNLGDGQRKGP